MSGPGYKVRLSGSAKPRFVFRRKTEAEMRRCIPRGLLFGLGIFLFTCSFSTIAGESGNLSFYKDYNNDMDWQYTGLTIVSALASISAMVLATMTSRKSALITVVLSLASAIVQGYLASEMEHTARHYSYFNEYSSDKSSDLDIWRLFGNENKTVLPYPFAWSQLFISMEFMPIILSCSASSAIFLLSLCSMFYLKVGISGEDEEEEDRNDIEDISGESKEKCLMTASAGMALLISAVVTSTCSCLVLQNQTNNDWSWDGYNFGCYSWMMCPAVYFLVGTFSLTTKSTGHKRTLLFLLLIPLIIVGGFGIFWSASFYRAQMRHEHNYLMAENNNGSAENFCGKSFTGDYDYYDRPKHGNSVCIPREKYCDGYVDIIGREDKKTFYYDDRNEKTRFPDESICVSRWTPAYVLVLLGHCVAVVTALTVGLQTCEDVPRSISVLFSALKSTASYIVIDKDMASSNSGSEENVALT